MADVIQIRRDTAANWTSVNPTLHQGEAGLETDTGKIKIGNGSTAWNSLSYSFVRMTGDETIAGVKTFSSSPIVPTATTATQAANLTNITKAVTPISDLSRIMQINGDGVPNIPDNVAGIVYTPNFSTTDSWITNNSTLSVANNILKITASTSSQYGASRVLSALNTKLFRFRIKTSRSTTVRCAYYNGSTFPIISQVTTVAGIWTYIDGYLASGSTNAQIYITTTDGATIGDTIEVSQVDTQVGSGLYDTPVYDKACCNRFTNNGVLPVKGLRGQALYFNGAQYLQADNPVIGYTGTIYGRISLASATISATQYIFENLNTSNRNGFALAITNTNALQLNSANASSIGANTIATVSNTLIHDFEIVIESSSSIKLYFDGAFVSTISPTYFPTDITGNLVVGGLLQTSTLASGFLGNIHDIGYRANLWTQDDVTRYHNGDDAVDSQQKAITNVPHSLATRDSKGNLRQPGLPVYADNTAALAGGLVAGEQYRTSTGVLMVVY